MATAPLDNADNGAPGGDQESAPIDFEAEARRLGWRPADEFKGKPEQHVDAETFYKRGQELMPILKAQNKSLERRLEAMEKDSKRAAEYFSKSEERAYNRALTDIRAEMEAAVEDGDLAAHRKAADKLDKLEKPSAEAPAPEHDYAKAAEEWADWGRENKWYAENGIMRTYAEAQAGLMKQPGRFLTSDDLRAISDKVKAKFPEEFTTAAPKPKNPVDGGGRIPPRGGGKTRNDLPPEARQMMDKWVRNGTIKSEADYLKSYQW